MSKENHEKRVIRSYSGKYQALSGEKLERLKKELDGVWTISPVPLSHLRSSRAEGGKDE